MTAEAHYHGDLHRLVDQLTDEQVAEARTFMLGLVRQRESRENRSGSARRQLSFIGIVDADPDLAERSEDILRELARRAR